MGNLIQGLMSNQKASDWFSNLSIMEMERMVVKHDIPRSFKKGDLTNGDVLEMFRKEHEI